MFRNKAFACILIAIIISLPACSPVLPTGAPAQDALQQTAAIQTQVADIVVKTLSAQTQVAEMTVSAAAEQTEISNSVASTLTALVTNTPEFTFTPTFTQSPSPTLTGTFTITPNFPRVTVGADTNCRSGPGIAYEILGLVKAGETAEIVGQDLERGQWVIRLPSNLAIICWIWRNSATVTGIVNTVPVFTPQPTPTPAIDFMLSYDGYTSCNGVYLLKFKIVNNSVLTWESNQVVATDRTANVTNTVSRNNFSNYDGCNLAGNDSNLAPGEVGTTTSNSFANNPSGHDFKATIQLCSSDGQSGTCVTRTIIFTP